MRATFQRKFRTSAKQMPRHWQRTMGGELGWPLKPLNLPGMLVNFATPRNSAMEDPLVSRMARMAAQRMAFSPCGQESRARKATTIMRTRRLSMMIVCVKEQAKRFSSRGSRKRISGRVDKSNAGRQKRGLLRAQTPRHIRKTSGVKRLGFSGEMPAL